MKRVLKIVSVLAVSGLLLISCGGGSSKSDQPPSASSTRAFVSNSFFGALNIIDYSKQAPTGASVSGFAQPGLMAVTPDHTTTLVFDQSSNMVSVVTNKTETNNSGPAMPAPVSSIVISTDSKTAYLATRNAPVEGKQNGAVQVMDIVNLTLGTQIPVPLVTNLVLSPDGKKLLAFSDQSDVATSIDFSQSTPAVKTIAGLSRPVAGVFSTDGSKAYIANCGPECGGSAAGVAVVDMTAATPSVVTTLNTGIDAASTIFIDSSNKLYVAGTKPGSTNGTLSELAVSGTSVSLTKGSISIGPGFHDQIVQGTNNKLFIAAENCASACLTIFDTSSATAVTPNDATGSVTGMAVVPRGNLVYVVRGGELLTYDTTTSAIFKGPCTSPLGSCFIDVLGKAVDVKIVDP